MSEGVLGGMIGGASVMLGMFFLSALVGPRSGIIRSGYPAPKFEPSVGPTTSVPCSVVPPPASQQRCNHEYPDFNSYKFVGWDNLEKQACVRCGAILRPIAPPPPTPHAAQVILREGNDPPPSRSGFKEGWQPEPGAGGASLDNPPKRNPSLPYAGSATAFRDPKDTPATPVTGSPFYGGI